MSCPHCHAQNPEGMRFCGHCGQPLERRCASCSAVLPAGFRFCGECGSPVQPAGTAAGAASAPPAAPIRPAAPEPVPARPALGGGVEGERKQVTVLCCSLAEGASAAEKLGAEDLHSLVDGFLALIRDQVERYGGAVNRLTELGAVVLFGAPMAHEDHALRGVLAALEIEKLVREGALAQRVGSEELRVRAGLATGPVVVGGAAGVAVGDTPRLAQRLHEAAAAGEVLLAAATARAARGPVVLEAAGERAAELGGEAVLRATGLQHEAGADSGFDAAALSPFVGRGSEVGVLEQLRDQAERGSGQVVGISGEAGAGKSRLVYELRRRMVDRRAVYLRGQCASYGAGIPYFPWLGLIRRASHIGPADPAAQVAAKMRRSLELIEPKLLPSLPFFLRLLDVADPSGELDRMEPHALQRGTFAAMRRMIFEASRNTLVVLELEDLHWVDETSEEFLASLVEELAAARVLVLLTYRSGYRPRWMDKSYATQITVRPLSAGDSRRVAEAVLRSGSVARGTIDALVAKAEGNPFFLEELARSMRDRRDGGDGVPDTVHDLIMSRIDRLPEEHKRLLRTASVLGREVSLELLESVWEASPAALEPLLEQLKKWEFLHALPGEERNVAFAHALVQEVAYQSLLSARRQALHLATARALEERFADRLEDAYDQLAFHYPLAGDAAKTVRYLDLFAGKAARGNAHAEAARAYDDAIEHAERLPEEGRDRRILELVLRALQSLLPLARFPDSLELLERHRERLEALDDPSLAGRFYFWLAHTHSYLGNPEEAARAAELSISAAHLAADEATEGKARYVLGRDGFWGGDFDAGVQNSLRAVVLLERTGELWWQGQAYWVAGFNHFARAEFHHALEALERARNIGAALDDNRLDSSWSLGYIHAAMGEWERGIEECQAGVERTRDPLNTVAALGFLGYALHEGGDNAAAVDTLGEAVRRVEGTGMLQLLGWFSTFLGEALLATGRLDEAQESICRGLRANEEARFRYGAALSRRALGRLALARGDDATAERELGDVLAAFDQLGVPFEVARTRLDLARLERGRGDEARAEELLAAAGALFTELELPVQVARTRALAARPAGGAAAGGESGASANIRSPS